MDDETTIRVNFGKPIPLFPLDSVVLLPQQVMPLHIFEPRYRQMIDEALDGSGQIAMAVFAGEKWKQEYHANPPIRHAVCIGQIVQHERLPKGRYNILLQGVCRAKVASEHKPDEMRMYRTAMLEPLGSNQVVEPETGFAIDQMRTWIEGELTEGDLRELSVADQMLEYVRNEDVPSTALIELISFALVTEPATRYQLLSEPELARRVDLVRGALEDLESIIRQARAQHPEAWPKGLSWN
ncbi:MAG: ATP-dependent protease [Phycisphaeraceae bacterium]|nr:MAG: ATP-dependent protease [Phycisphaeraceae bacterium]